MGIASVVTDIAPLFNGPGVDTGRLDEELFGMSVQVIDETEDGWCYVRTEHNTEGYMPASCLDQKADVATAWRRYPKQVVLAPYIDILRGPEWDTGRIASIPRGGLVVALGEPGLDGWRKVGLPTGTTGYTRTSYIGDVIKDWSQLEPEDMRWNIVESALSYNGTAYRKGGRTPLGIDGVGLATMSYALNGVEIWHEDYFKPGLSPRKIPRDNMDEGDLLYFNDGTVGIYMGNGQFVYATRKEGLEGVVVGSLRQKDSNYQPQLAETLADVASIF